ncbi:fumarylacetoacetate hydrolase family protein [Ornithinimicrobium cavernae]|uniref:fumarylacetoacetate hydrolase family protein n=1 Tax=Ornithinimicrobium cavernae TaxID=2666047 RepID=UPI000D698645|nr:fumarylacetoacetate hydrolase family protein [Ornithinimicrobium cavernae]
MHLATITEQSAETPVLVDPDRGVIAFAALGNDVPTELLEAIRAERITELTERAAAAPDSAFRPVDAVQFTAPYRHPRMIWGIGLNYVDHASDLSESVPEEPASFIKLDHTIIGPGDPIPIPVQSQRTTSEAEMGLVIGRHCRNVEPEEALDYVLGVVNVLDQTAEDILQRNPRFLTRSKNFPGFFSFGPRIVPLEEVAAHAGGVPRIQVSTVVNGDQIRSNTVERMRYSPASLISFHSKVMPLQPGDIISPGTPGAIHVSPGDVVECQIPGLGVLRNPVVAG